MRTDSFAFVSQRRFSVRWQSEWKCVFWVVLLLSLLYASQTSWNFFYNTLGYHWNCAKFLYNYPTCVKVKRWFTVWSLVFLMCMSFCVLFFFSFRRPCRVIFEVLDIHNLANEKWKHKLLFDFYILRLGRKGDHFTCQIANNKDGWDRIVSVQWHSSKTLSNINLVKRRKKMWQLQRARTYARTEWVWRWVVDRTTEKEPKRKKSTHSTYTQSTQSTSGLMLSVFKCTQSSYA